MRLSQLAASLPTEKHSEVSHPDTTHREPKHWNHSSNGSVYSVNSETKCNCLGVAVAKPDIHEFTSIVLKKAELRASPWGTPLSLWAHAQKTVNETEISLGKMFHHTSHIVRGAISPTRVIAPTIPLDFKKREGTLTPRTWRSRQYSAKACHIFTPSGHSKGRKQSFMSAAAVAPISNPNSSRKWIKSRTMSTISWTDKKITDSMRGKSLQQNV